MSLEFLFIFRANKSLEMVSLVGNNENIRTTNLHVCIDTRLQFRYVNVAIFLYVFISVSKSHKKKVK